MCLRLILTLRGGSGDTSFFLPFLPKECSLRVGYRDRISREKHAASLIIVVL